MDKAEAAELADEVQASFQQKSYAELADMLLNSSVSIQRAGSADVEYQIEVQGFWDSGKPGDLRVIISIDDGGWRAFRPLTSDFVMRPDGTVV